MEKISWKFFGKSAFQ